MKTYSKNIYRTILKNIGLYLGAVLIISLGVFVYCGMKEFLLNLDNTVEQYCDDNEFADVFATVKAMPRSSLSELETVEGVAEVFGRLEVNARMIPAEGNGIVTLHIMAWSHDDAMNHLVLDPEPEEIGYDEIYLGPLLAKHYGIHAGDTVTVISGSQARRFLYRGSVSSPEQMFMVPDESVPAMDNAIYDLAAMSRPALEALTGKVNTVTNIGIKLETGYTFSDVQYALKEKLQRYGYIELCSRRNQSSYSNLVEEIENYALIIALLPTIFMLVTMFMLYVVLRKIVDSDRTLIGTLKAFGARDSEILLRYMGQGVLIGLLGGILPIGFAEIAGKVLYEDDIFYYSIPLLIYTAHVSVWAKGIGIALFTSLTALFFGVIGVLGITPAESMRAPAPKAGITVNLPPVIKRTLNARQAMGLRAIFRNPLRSLIIALAVSLPFALMSSFGSFEDVMQQTLYDQYLKAETYDLRIRLEEDADEAAVRSMLKGLGHVKEYETVSSYTVQLKKENRSEYTALSVLNPGSDMFRIIDIYNDTFEPREDGLLLSEGLAHKMNIQAGDVIEISGIGLTRTDETVRIPVIRLVKTGFGSGCYISADGIERCFQTHFRPNTVLLDIEDGQRDAVLAYLQNTRGVTYVVENERMLERSVYMMDVTVLMLKFLAVFSLIVGFIIIYSVINISMRERRNEFGTMIILGMNSARITEIILFEQTLNFILGIILGFPLSRVMCKVIEYAVSTDTLSIDMQISSGTYIAVFLICAVATALSLFIIVRGILSMQLTEVLKNRE